MFIPFTNETIYYMCTYAYFMHPRCIPYVVCLFWAPFVYSFQSLLWATHTLIPLHTYLFLGGSGEDGKPHWRRRIIMGFLRRVDIMAMIPIGRSLPINWVPAKDNGFEILVNSEKFMFDKDPATPTIDKFLERGIHNKVPKTETHLRHYQESPPAPITLCHPPKVNTSNVTPNNHMHITLSPTLPMGIQSNGAINKLPNYVS